MQSFRLEVKNEKASSWVTQKSNSVRTRVSLSHLCRLKDFFFELLIDSFFFFFIHLMFTKHLPGRL